jgi:holo-[acyl-carrier protein] synthase
MRVGIDLIEIDRFANIAKDDAKLATLFTQKERDYCMRLAHANLHLAGTFAVKEAVAKAFKTGFNGKIRPIDIEVERIDGVPQVNLYGEAKRFFEANNFKELEISITHSKTDASAICIIN